MAEAAGRGPKSQDARNEDEKKNGDSLALPLKRENPSRLSTTARGSRQAKTREGEIRTSVQKFEETAKSATEPDQRQKRK